MIIKCYEFHLLRRGVYIPCMFMGNVKDTIVCFTCNFVNDFTSLLCSGAFCAVSPFRYFSSLGEEKVRLILSVVSSYDVIIDCLTTTVSRQMRTVARFKRKNDI